MNTPNPKTIQYAEYILNHYSKDSHADHICLARDMELKGIKIAGTPICPICKTDDAMVFHIKEQKWFCHHTHSV